MPRQKIAHILCWVVIVWLGSGQTTYAQSAPPIVWARAATGAQLNFARRTAADAAGEVYVAGEFMGTVTFAGRSLTSQGDLDVYLAKYDAAGQLLWLRQAGGPGLEQVWGLAVDAAGNACITGKFNPLYPSRAEDLSLDPFHLSATSDEAYVAKYDPAGRVVWARQTRLVPGPRIGGDTYGSDVALDAAGNVYLTGAVGTSAAFDQVQVSPGGLFLAKYDAQGTVQWVNAGLGYNGSIQEKVAVDAQGHVYLVGYYIAPLTLAGTALTPPPNQNGAIQTGTYLAQFSEQGVAQWAHPFPGLGGFAGLAVDASGAVLTTGFRGTFADEGHSFTSLGSSNTLTLKYSPQGHLLWGRQLGGDKGVLSYAAPAVDGAGNAYVDVILRGMQTLTTPSGTDDVFNYLVSYSPAGDLRWNRPFATPYANGIAVSRADELWVVGGFHAPTLFDNFALTPGSAAADNTFVVKLADALLPPSPVPGPTPPFAWGRVPNVITPNGDGLNDAFRLPGLPPGPWQLQVYSRWGQRVFASENYQQDWTAPGLADGLYYYCLQNPHYPSLTGWLEVLH